ncbi:S1C family serine protease [Thalassoglobus sp.]|uniref:S1C family serine protease n=1 Tax=Thalassoglobus sp. TaxID=2795869 RepID=UPI003AA86259
MTSKHNQFLEPAMHLRASRWMPVVIFFLMTQTTAFSQTSVVVPEAVLQAQQHRIETVERVASSVVAIFAPGGQGGGSGVLISSDGFAVTNFHVVQGLGGFMKCGLNDGRLYDAVLVGIDPTGDVAVVKLLGRDDFPHAEIGDSDTVKMGDWTFAMGNPFLLADDFQPTVTYGMVSGTHRYQYPAGTFLEYTDCIQVDTSINAGNSGGPLFNINGEVIGINGRISVEKRGKVNVGAGYSISINQVMHFLDHLKSGRIVDHATLGATVTSTSDGAVVVSNILETSEAYRRGLRQGDELISFAGRPVRSVNQYKNILGIYPKSWQVPLSFQRDGARFDIVVQLAGLHRRAELAGGPPPNKPEPDEKEKPKIPIPIPHMGKKQEPDIPKEYLKLYEEKSGYANYYFNQIAQDRFLESIRRWGDFNSKPRMWALDATFKDGAPLQIRMQPEAIAAKFEQGFAVLELGGEFTAEPMDSGGLLASLEQLKQLLIDPKDYFTEFYYVGSEPLDGQGERVDVLVTTKGLLTSRWYFQQESGALIGVDTVIDEEHDSCRIRFGEMRDFDGVKFPSRLTVRSGGQVWGELDVTSLKFLDPDSKGSP